jgi:glycosyltransferase involved in cell wall biosynthesis
MSTSRRRIVLYTETMSRGGAEVSLRNLATALDPALEVSVMGVEAEICEWVASARPGTEVILVPPVTHKFAVLEFLALRRKLTALRPAIFHTNLRELADARHALTAATTVRGILPVAVEQLPLAPRTLTTRWLKRAISKRLAAHVAVGVKVARMVEADIGLPRGSVQTIYNGVPDHGPAATRAAGGPTIFGTLARLDHIKGLDLLLGAVAQLPNAQLLIAGDGPDRDSIRAQAKRLGLGERLRLLSWTEHAHELFDEIDVFVLPSRLEGFPLSIVEAMLAARPVVATDVGSVREAVIDGVTGRVIQPDDVGALRDALGRLVGDAAEQRRLGDAGRTRALEHFTVDRMARQFEQLYAELLVTGA